MTSKLKQIAELLDLFGRCDNVQKEALIATLEAMTNGATNAQAAEAGNVVLIAAGRKPVLDASRIH